MGIKSLLTGKSKPKPRKKRKSAKPKPPGRKKPVFGKMMGGMFSNPLDEYPPTAKTDLDRSEFAVVVEYLIRDKDMYPDTAWMSAASKMAKGEATWRPLVGHAQRARGYAMVHPGHRLGYNNPGLTARQQKILKAMADDADPVSGPVSVIELLLSKYWRVKASKSTIRKDLDALVDQRLVARRKNVSTGAWEFYITNAGIKAARTKAKSKPKRKSKSKPKRKFDPLKAIMGDDPYSNPEATRGLASAVKQRLVEHGFKGVKISGRGGSRTISLSAWSKSSGHKVPIEVSLTGTASAIDVKVFVTEDMMVGILLDKRISNPNQVAGVVSGVINRRYSATKRTRAFKAAANPISPALKAAKAAAKKARSGTKPKKKAKRKVPTRKPVKRRPGGNVKAKPKPKRAKAKTFKPSIAQKAKRAAELQKKRKAKKARARRAELKKLRDVKKIIKDMGLSKPGKAKAKAKTRRKAGRPIKARKNPTKTQLSAVASLFKEVRKKAAESEPQAMKVKLMVDETIHDSPRHFALTGFMGKRGGPIHVHIAPELAAEPKSVIRGILRHEFGHVIQFLGKGAQYGSKLRSRSYDAKERQADRIAEKIFNTKIYYDKRGVEVSGPGAKGKRPRPKGLR